MDNVLADKPSTQPSTLIDTLSEDTHDTNHHFEDDKQSDKHSDCPVSFDERASSAESESTKLDKCCLVFSRQPCYEWSRT